MKHLIVASAFFSASIACMVSSAQTPEELSVLPAKVDEAPKVAPTGCTGALITGFDNIQGSPSFVRLKQELVVMEFGHSASQELMSALTQVTGNDVGTAYMHVNLGLTDALNGYLCGSFLTARFKASVTNPDMADSESAATRTLIMVFNRMAMQSIQLRAQMRTAAEDAENGKNGLSVSNADKTAATLQDRKDAGSDFENVVNLSLLLMYDTSDKNAAVVDTLNMSCSERDDALRQVTTLSDAAKVDEFTRGAKTFKEFLAKKKCKAK